MSRPSERSAIERQALHDRQLDLLRYLSRPQEQRGDAPLPDSLVGLPRDRLNLLGRLILAKRLQKIEALLPATCRVIHAHAPHLIQRFAECCPAASIGRVENARQFHHWLRACVDLDELAFLTELVEVEWTVTRTNLDVYETPPAPTAALSLHQGPVNLRRAPRVQLRTTSYDLQATLAGVATPERLSRGPSRTVAVAAGPDGARAFWLDDDTAELLRFLDAWTRLTRDQGSAMGPMLQSLHAAALIEVQPCDWD